MAGVSALGVGSGADFAKIVDDLVQAEGEVTVGRLDAEEAKTTTKLSSYGILKSSIATFKASVAALSSSTAFDVYKSSQTDADAFEITLDNSKVTAATYSLEVTTLGVAHQVTSNTFANSTTALNLSGELRISVGSDQFSVSVDTTDSLNNIRDSINDAVSNTGVSTSVINTGSNAVLVFSSDDAGTGNRIKVEIVNDGDGDNTDNSGLSQFAYDFDNPGESYITETTAAVDTEIVLNGQTIINTGGNKFSTALDGVTIVAKKATVGTQTFTISQDNLAIFNMVEAMVTAFNNSYTSFTDLGKFDAVTGQKGDLLGDAILRIAKQQIYSSFSDSYLSSTDTFNRLTELGVEVTDTGKLKLNDSKLSSALNSDFIGVKKFFTDSSLGFAVKLDTKLEAYTKQNGVIESKEQGLNLDLEDIAEQRVDMEKHLEKLESRLIAQFTNLDIMLAQMKQTSDFLDTQLSALENLVAGKKS